MLAEATNSYEWLIRGDLIFSALLAAINSARETVRLETYTFANDRTGQRFLAALVDASRRGVVVQVLVDAFGSMELPGSFWNPLRDAGGEMRWFDPTLRSRLGARDHRKMLVCDEEKAFVGGFNISVQYEGDGVNAGWRDLGLGITGPLVAQLATAFDGMFATAGQAGLKPKRAGAAVRQRKKTFDEAELLLTGRGHDRYRFSRVLRKHLTEARSIQIICAYFLPTWRIRHALIRAAKRGVKVQLILPGKSDVRVSQYAGRSLYRRLLKAGIEIYEYQPHILHAKLIILDDVIYVGSSNLDPRSLYINFELVVRIKNPKVTDDARRIFENDLQLSHRIDLAAWRKSRTWWVRFRQHWSYFLLVRIDPFVARWLRGRGIR